MTANRIEAMQQLASNLRSEGQTSRADAVMELIHEVMRLQDLLDPDYYCDEDEDEGYRPIRGILVKEEAELDRCMCSSYCGETSPAIIDTDICADSVESLIEYAAEQLPVHQGKDAPAQLYIVGRNLTEELRAAFDVRVKAAIEKQKEAEKIKEQSALEAAIKRAEARVAELSTGAAIEDAKAALRALQEKRGW